MLRTQSAGSSKSWRRYDCASKHCKVELKSKWIGKTVCQLDGCGKPLDDMESTVGCCTGCLKGHSKYEVPFLFDRAKPKKPLKRDPPDTDNDFCVEWIGKDSCQKNIKGKKCRNPATNGCCEPCLKKSPLANEIHEVGIKIYDLRHQYYRTLIDNFREYGEIFIKLYPEIFNDKEFIEQLMDFESERNGELSGALEFEYASEQLRDDREYVLKIVGQYAGCYSFQYVSERLRGDREVALAAIGGLPYGDCGDYLGVKTEDYAIRFVSDELKNDRTFILEAVKLYPYVLRYVGMRFRRDIEILTAAVRKNPGVLDFVELKLRKRREIELAQVQHDGLYLGKVSETYAEDPEFAIAALSEYYSVHRYDGEVFEFIRPVLWENPEFVNFVNTDRKFSFWAVSHDGNNLKYLSDEWKNDLGIVSHAVEQTHKAYQYAMGDTQTDLEVLYYAGKSKPLAIGRTIKGITLTEQFIVKSIGKYPDLFEEGDEEFRDNVEIFEAASIRRAEIFAHAGPNIKSDKKIALDIVKRCRRMIKFVSEDLRNNPELISASEKRK